MGHNKKVIREKIPEIPASETNAKTLEDAINRKYGSKVRFCEIVRWSRPKLYKLLSCSEDANVNKLNKLRELINNTPDCILEGEIRPTVREAIHGAIYGPSSKFKTGREFCKQHPQFDNTWVSRVIRGYYIKLTPKIKSMCDILNVKY